MHNDAFGPVRDQSEAIAYAKLVAHAFAWPEGISIPWVEAHGHEHIRVVRRGGTLAGGLLLMPMGTSFGGRRVGLTGVAAVVVPPEHRGSGVGTELMRGAIDEIARAGTALSGLYPATLPVYRKAGYETAGVRCWTKIDLARVRVAPTPRGTGLPLRAMRDDDTPAVRALYARLATRVNGHLDRPQAIWSQKIERWRGEPARGYVVERNGTIEGYMYIVQVRPGTAPMNLVVTDLVGETPAALHRLVSMIADHWSMAGEAAFPGPIHHPALMAFQERCFSVEILTHWMLRVTNAPRAFAERGYPGKADAEAHLAIDDPLVPANAGRWIFRVRAGVGSLEPGGRGDLQLHIRGLAPVFSGFADATWLMGSGLAEGEHAAAETLCHACAGPMPWMSEIY